jgi:hypothetical protein
LGPSESIVTSKSPNFNRNIELDDDIELVDMEMSDDDTGMDNRSVGSSGGELNLWIEW